MVELGAIQDDVVFDWSAAADLAAEFRTTATVLEEQIPRRNAIAGRARQEWRGVYAEEFSGRMLICTRDAEHLADAMMQAAKQVDELARLAREEQTRREKAREWVEQQADRDAAEKLKDLVTGDGDKPPTSRPPEPPVFVSSAPAEPPVFVSSAPQPEAPR
jgi:uncharacterized protein YukE